MRRGHGHDVAGGVARLVPLAAAATLAAAAAVNGSCSSGTWPDAAPRCRPCSSSPTWPAQPHRPGPHAGGRGRAGQRRPAVPVRPEARRSGDHPDGGGQRRVHRGLALVSAAGRPWSPSCAAGPVSCRSCGNRPPRWPSPRSGPGSPRTSATSCERGIDEIGRLAGPRSARDSAEADPPFAAIELAGRAIPDSLRQAVGTLRDTPVEPEPGLAELGGPARPGEHGGHPAVPSRARPGRCRPASS